MLVLTRKKGASKLNRPSIRGDHLFTLKVGIPKCISTKERELLEELASLDKPPTNQSIIRPKVQQPADDNTQSEIATEDESEDQTDLWSTLKDLARLWHQTPIELK